MDQHSIANKRLMDQVIRSRPVNPSNTPSSTPSNFSSSSTSTNTASHNTSIPNSTSSQNLAQLNQNLTSTNTSVLAQAGYHAVAHTHTVQNPQLLAQNKKRAAAERAAIQQKIKNNITKSQMEAKKQKENHEKTRLWEDVVLPNWEDYVHSSKLRDLCVKGIPNKLRGRVWPLLVQNELGIDEDMFETLCAEAQLLFHDKMTAARSRRKKAVNRESNAYGYQLPSNSNLANMAGNSQTSPENQQSVSQHHHHDHTTSNTILEEDDMLSLDDDPLDADYYPKQTYILDEDAAMALESEGPYLFHHPHTTPASEMLDGSTTGGRYRTASTGGHAHSQVQQPIPIPHMNGNLDLTEEDWFENERNGSMDEETFKLVQKQLFVKPVILPGLPVPGHLQPSLNNNTNNNKSRHPSKEEENRDIHHSDSHHHNSAYNGATNTSVRRHSHTGGPSTSSLLFTPQPTINITQYPSQNQCVSNNITIPNAIANKPLLQRTLLALSHDNNNGNSNSGSYHGNMANSREVASSVESNKYDPNTDFLPFDFDEDDAMVRTPIKSAHATPLRSKNIFSNHSGMGNNTNSNNSNINDKDDMQYVSVMSVVIDEEHPETSMLNNTNDNNNDNIVKPIALLSPTPSAARVRRSVLDIFDDEDEETPFGSNRHSSHNNHYNNEDKERDNENNDVNKNESTDEEEEEEGHSIMLPRLSRSSGAMSASSGKLMSELHGVLSRPTSALDHVLNHNNNSTVDTPITPAETGNYHTNNETPTEDTSPKMEDKLDPPNPKLERLLRVVSLIEWDLPRTFPTLAFFHDGGVMHTGLERILLCFALYCPEIGYVQGLSFLVAMLLLQCMDEYEVFVCLTNMILAPSRGSLQDFYRIQKASIDTFVGCFDYFFKKYLPLLHEHFHRESVESLMFLMDWHLSLFTKALPIEIAAKIWDVYLLEGEVYVLSVGLGVLKMYASKLASFSVEKISKFLLHLPDTIKSDELFAHVAQINITKKQYERIRKRFETSSSVASPPSQHVPTFPSQHTNKHHLSHDHKNNRTLSDTSHSASGGYFSTSIFKSAVRSSIRALRTAVSSSSSSTTTTTTSISVNHVSSRSASTSHVGNARVSTNYSYNNHNNSVSPSAIDSPASNTTSSHHKMSSSSSSSNNNNDNHHSGNVKFNNHVTQGTDRGEANITHLGTTPTSTHSSSKMSHSTSQQNLQEFKTSQNNSRSFSSLVSEVDDVSLALYNAGFLSMPPAVNHSSPSSSNRSSPSNSSNAHLLLTPGGSSKHLSIRRQTKSVNSLCELETAHRQQPQPAKGTQTSDSEKRQQQMRTVASSQNQYVGDSGGRRLAQGDDEGPSFVGTSLEQQSQILNYNGTAAGTGNPMDRPKTPPTRAEKRSLHEQYHQNQNRSSLYEKDRPTPIAPTRQRIVSSSGHGAGPGSSHHQQYAHHNNTINNNTHAQQKTMTQPRRHSATSGTSSKKKEGGDCIPS